LIFSVHHPLKKCGILGAKHWKNIETVYTGHEQHCVKASRTHYNQWCSLH